MKKKLIIVSFISLLSYAQIFDSNNFIPSADQAFTLSTDIENQSILVSFKLAPATYISVSYTHLTLPTNGLV